MRLAMLAYGRNDGSGLAYHALKESGKVTMLELQFKSLRHKEHKSPGISRTRESAFTAVIWSFATSYRAAKLSWEA